MRIKKIINNINNYDYPQVKTMKLSREATIQLHSEKVLNLELGLKESQSCAFVLNVLIQI